MNRPFTLRIFVPAGDPEGLRVVERSNWPGKALVFPRSLYADAKARDELKQTGIYLLTGPDDSQMGDRLYVGEGDPVRPRLDSHNISKDFWTKVIVFVGSHSLNKAHVQYLEARMVAMARATKRATLDNGNYPAEPTLSESDRADMEVFLENVLTILPILGVNAFEQPAPSRVERRSVALFCIAKGLRSEGYESTQGFVVRTGSQASLHEVPSIHQYMRDHRAELVQKGVMVANGNCFCFTQDFTFSSPSTAAGVILGRSANGRTEWKTATGDTLKSLQEQESQGG